MRTALGHAVLALVLIGLGFGTWTAGVWQRHIADAREDLALLQYDAVEDEYNALEQSMGVAGSVPWLGDAVRADMERDRAAAAYWRGRYDALAPDRDSGAGEAEPSRLAVEANAAYRAGQRESGDRQTILHRLDDALKTYTNLLKKNPGDADSAYNYELIVRLRDSLSKSRPQPVRREEPADARKSTAIVMAGDLPDGRTLHGDPGAPPPSTDMTQFKMHIPVRPDERQGGSEAGQGKQKVRKG